MVEVALLEEDLVDDDLLDDETEEDRALTEDVVLDSTSTEFVKQIVDRTMIFLEYLCDTKLFPYQQQIARRIIESLIINDGEEITVIQSRQSGKSEVLANVVATVMVLFPKLAPMFPDLLGKFDKGVMVGTFAPVESQAETLYGRIVDRLTSERAIEVMLDPEIDDKPTGGGKIIKLARSGSFCRMQTANPRAKIESKSYHFIVIDEAQHCDDYTVRKSIHPMGAFYNATIVKTGTPDVTKGDFYSAIQHNKRRQTKGRRQNHFEFDYRACAKYNPNYAKFIAKEKLRIGEDSDEFQLSYACRWLLERGMFTSDAQMEALGDKSMEVVKAHHRSPVVVGIDPARKMDSTVVTVVWVDWDRPDEFGFYDHRILNWMELQGDDWEEQYFRVIEFLANYDVLRVGVDAQGVGDAVAQRLAVLMPDTEVVPVGSNSSDQSTRWKHLMQLMQRGMVGWPAHAKTRRLRTYRRFHQQMVDLEKKYQGKYMLAAAPEEAEAHDDYPDSLAIACSMTIDATMPEVEVSESPFVAGTRRR